MLLFIRCVLVSTSLLAAWGCSSRVPAIDRSQLAACGADGGPAFVEEQVVVGSARHTTAALDFGDEVPVGGDHNPCWGSWGVQTVPLPAERFIHNMEHGGVVLLYHCEAKCDAELTWLTAFTESSELTILTEYPDMTSRFAIAAWGARATSECLDPDFVLDFYQRHVDRGPEHFSRPPPGPPPGCE